MARKKEHPYDLAVHREDRPAKPRRRAGPPRREARAAPDPPPGFAELEALVGPAFRDELPRRLSDIDPRAMLEILAPLPAARQAMEWIAENYRKERNEKKRGSHAWHRQRVRETFKRFAQAVEEFYSDHYRGAAPDSPVNPVHYPVLRLTRELRDYFASNARDNLIAWTSPRKPGPVTAYATNDGLTHGAAARHLLKARFGMGRIQQDWWLRAVGATPSACESLPPKNSP